LNAVRRWCRLAICHVLRRWRMNQKQLLGIIGSAILFVGVFTPIVSAPFVGGLNYFQNGKGDGTIILALALISLVLALLKKYKGLWFTGIGSAVVLLFTFIMFQIRVSEMQSEMDRQLAGNPFADIAKSMAGSVQLQWGWALLVVGAVLLMCGAAIKDKHEPGGAPAPPEQSR